MAGKLQTTVIGSFPKPDYLLIRDWFATARENGTMGSTDLHRTVGVLTQCFRLQTPRKKERKQNNERGHQKVTPIIIGRKHETNCQRSLGIGISTRWASSWQLHLVCVQPLNSSVKSSFRAILTTILLPVLRGCFFVTRFVTRRVGWLFSAGFRASPSGS